MIDTSNGSLKISGELTFFPGYSFDQFKQTKFYKNQDGRRIIYLESQKLMDNKNYIVSLFFRNEKLYIVSLVCCDQKYSEKEEEKRKLLHDAILRESGIEPDSQYDWGKILSEYDAKSNLSSINIIYKESTSKKI